MKTRKLSAAASATCLLGVIACSGEDATCLSAESGSCEHENRLSSEGENDAETRNDVPFAELLEQLEPEASVGARGDGVRALHRYLRRYGYLPNEELAAQYPAWNPLVAEDPSRDDVFDEHTAEALMAFQRGSDLAPTGVLDEATRERLSAPRCGLPEGIQRADPSEKFGHYGPKLTSTSLTWRVINVNGLANSELIGPGGTTCTTTTCKINVVTAALSTAFATWSAATEVTFTHVASGPVDIEVQFADLDDDPSDGQEVARGTLPGTSGVKPFLFDNESIWSHQDPSVPIGTANDIVTVALHEIGHILGLLHSSVFGPAQPGSGGGGATMTYTASGVDRTLHPDDTVAASLLYDTWHDMGGPAKDIGVGGDGSDANTAPDVWVVGSAPVAGQGFGIHKWTGTTPFAATYSQHATGGKGAVRIAVAGNGRPWIINSAGEIYERTNTDPTTGSWQLRGPGCAHDIGVGLNSTGGAAWILGCSVDANGNRRIYRWTGSEWEEPNPGAAGVRISVDGRDRPWVVAASGTIWRRVGLNWTQVLGGAQDIGAGPGVISNVEGTLDVTSFAYVTGPGGGIWARNQQLAVAGDPGFTPAANTWVQTMDGEATQIAVGPDAVPWVLAASGSIWRQL